MNVHNRKIYIVFNFDETSAATVRMLSYAKAFKSFFSVNLIIVQGTGNYEPWPDVDCEYHEFFNKNRFIMYYQAAQFIKHDKNKNSIIFVYGTPLICMFFKRNENVFFECTEFPSYGRPVTIFDKIKDNIKLILSKRTKGLLVITKNLKKFYESKGYNKPIEVINMFVDSTRFENVKANQKNKYICYCGSISNLKDGVDILIQAFSRFHSIKTEYKLVIIGKFINNNVRSQLLRLVEKLGIAEYVTFTGGISPMKMPYYLCNATILALARPDSVQARFGFPTKLGEYLCTGKPVVVTCVGEIPDYLSAKTAIFANPNDWVDFSDKLLWVDENYQEALKIAREGQNLAKTCFSAEVQAKKASDFMINNSINF